MNHIKGFRTLNRTHSHRRALYRNMVTALFNKERIMTTTIKAKEIKRVAEKIITKARVKNLHNIRIVSRFISDKDILKKLFDEIAPRYVDRAGGYTRIIKLGKRKGDGAEVSYLELVAEVAKGKKKKKKTSEKKDATKKVVKDKKEDVVSTGDKTITEVPVENNSAKKEENTAQ